MTDLTNADRAAAVAAREAKAPPAVERQFLDSRERLHLDQIDSANASLQDALKRLGTHEAHIRLHDSDAGWAAYGLLYERIEGYARALAKLTGQGVHIPERMVRKVATARLITDDWDEQVKAEDQPGWFKDPVKRAHRSERIAAENAGARDQRFADVTGTGLRRSGK